MPAMVMVAVMVINGDASRSSSGNGDGTLLRKITNTQ